MRRIISNDKIIISVLFIFSFFVFLYPGIANDYPLGDDAYLHLRMANYLIENKWIMQYDPLSFGGREVLYPPLYHILLAVSILFVGENWAMDILPSLLGALSIIVFYYLSREFVEKRVAVASSFILVTIPGFLFWNASHSTPMSLVLLLFISSILLFVRYLKNNEKKYLISGLLFTFALSQTSLLVLVLPTIIFLYSLIMRDSKILKVAIFCGILAGIGLFPYIFKLILLDSFPREIPDELQRELFSPLNFFTLLYWGGIISLLTLIGAYVKRNDKKYWLFLIWAGFFIFLALIGRLEIFRAFGFAAPAMAVLAASFLDIKRRDIVYILIILFALSWQIPLAYNTFNVWFPFSQDEYDAFSWIKENTPENSTVLGWRINKKINTLSERENIYDGFFEGAPDLNQRYYDTKIILSTANETQTLWLLNKYSVDYILVTKEMRRDFWFGLLEYVDNSIFYKEVYPGKDAQVFEVIYPEEISTIYINETRIVIEYLNQTSENFFSSFKGA